MTGCLGSPHPVHTQLESHPVRCRRRDSGRRLQRSTRCTEQPGTGRHVGTVWPNSHPCPPCSSRVSLAPCFLCLCSTCPHTHMGPPRRRTATYRRHWEGQRGFSANASLEPSLILVQLGFIRAASHRHISKHPFPPQSLAGLPQQTKCRQSKCSSGSAHLTMGQMRLSRLYTVPQVAMPMVTISLSLWPQLRVKSRTASPTCFITPAWDPPVMIQAPGGQRGAWEGRSSAHSNLLASPYTAAGTPRRCSISQVPCLPTTSSPGSRGDAFFSTVLHLKPSSL